MIEVLTHELGYLRFRPCRHAIDSVPLLIVIALGDIAQVWIRQLGTLSWSQ